MYLTILTNLLYHFCFQNVQPDKEIVVDTIMFLWQKCKLGIQRINLPRNDYAKFTQKISTNKVFLFISFHLHFIIANLSCDAHFKSKFSLFIHVHNYRSLNVVLTKPFSKCIPCTSAI